MDGSQGKSTLRLGLVGPLPPPNGGMAMQTRQLAGLLAAEGVSVELLRSNAPYRPAFVGRVRGLRALFRLLPYLAGAWRLAGRSDVIHLMANSGWSWQLFAAPVLWLAALRGTPVIVNYRGGEARQYLAASQRWVRPSMRRAASLVVPSDYLREVFEEFGFEARVIPNIIDLETFVPAHRAQAADVFSFAITRNLEAIYGLDTALHALALAREKEPRLRLEIAGSGPLRDELHALAARLGVADDVHFLGRLERKDVVALYHRAQALLNPSRVDNMPNSVLEGMACGLPVLTTNVGGVPFIAEHGRSALLVPADDARSMAEGMLRLAHDSSLCAALSQTAREDVARYGWDRVRPQWLSLYREHGLAA